MNPTCKVFHFDSLFHVVSGKLTCAGAGIRRGAVANEAAIPSEISVRP